MSEGVLLLYSGEHALHAPEGELEQGAIIPYREAPVRVESLYAHLVRRGLGLPARITRTATVDDLYAIHALSMLDFLEALSHSTHRDDIYQYADSFPIRGSMGSLPRSLAGRMGAYCTDPYSPVGRGTWRAACAAAGLALQGAEMILRRQASTLYALCRPPGHHAGPDFFGSYCYLNNAALAAHRLRAMGRVAVLDIDYHHGNGTQAIFWEEPLVLYASLHIDPNYDFPYFSGYAHETGGGHAPGSTYNLPLNPGIDSSAYLSALDALLHAIRAFQPAALVVSLGYDTFQGDPLSAFRVEAAAFAAIGARIGMLDLPTLLVQEGGYAFEMLPTLAENFLTGFLGARKGA
jgi:acetoin utilization deacetylase AcuC-like enzyme